MKIYKNLLKFLQERKSASYLAILLLSCFFILIFMLFNPVVFASTQVNSSLANLTIWETTDTASRWTYQNCYDTYTGKCIQKSLNEYNVFFYANFTNKTSGGDISDTTGNCSIRFEENLTGTFNAWVNMSYTSSTGQYQYNRSFNYKGGIPFEVNCTDPTYSRINASENATISNTAPAIHAKDAGGNLPTQSITEDTLFYYNFSLNCSDDDLNDISSLVFNYTAAGTTLTNFTLSSSGNLTVNMSTDGDVGSGSKKILFTCSDSEAPDESANISFTITAVNDAPSFTNVNSTINATEGQEFSLRVNATDEEDDRPFWFNVTFTSCELATWSDRGSNCTLFSINPTTGMINFTPTNNDVGNFTLEFNVTDAGNTNNPVNATTNITVNITVLNVNDAPNLTYVCNNRRSTTENEVFSCIVNATDTDENSNLTFISNTTWFTLNNSLITFAVNLSNSQGEANISFTANDSAVGVWYINISVNDSVGGMDSEVINFNVSNVNDSMVMGNINDSYTTYASAEFNLEVNASDDDLRIPEQGKSCSEGCYNESFTFTVNITNTTGGTDGVNTSLFTIVNNASAGTVGNTSFAYIQFTPLTADAGNYTINVTVRDANNYSVDSEVFNLTLYGNSAPYWINITATSFSFNEGATFTLNLNVNATDTEGDAVTFTDNTGLFDISSTGLISIGSNIANDSRVGIHTEIITITDSKDAYNSSQSFTFTIKNVNETPVLSAIADQTVNEDSLLTVNFAGNDDDLNINTSSSDFYWENIVWSINSTTANFASKLNFAQSDNRTASISFTPNKTDVGNHTINITLNDSTGRMDSQEFNLSVSSINHAPVLDPIGPKNASENSEFYLDLNATDVEDGSENDTGVGNFRFAANETWTSINVLTGELNFTPTSSQVGIHWINVSVNDSESTTDSEVFKLSVFSANEAPTIADKIPPTYQLNTAENCTSCLSFLVNVTDPNAGAPNNDLLTVVWSVDGVVNSTETNVRSGRFSAGWKYYTNFTDETTNSTAHNISVRVSDPDGNATEYSWNVTTTHANAPVEFVAFSDPIKDVNASSTTSVTVSCNLATGSCSWDSSSTYAIGYFSDIDYDDPMYNQSINFTLSQYDADCNESASDITASINANTLIATFYYGTTGSIKECFSITALDSIDPAYNRTSGNFTVNLTVSAPITTTTPTPVSGGGGGGGGARKVPIALKIIVPEPVTMFTIDKIIVPIGLENIGNIDLYNINLSAVSTLDGIRIELSETYFPKLLSGKKEEFEMTVITQTNDTGTYEITLSASSKKPKYTDTASFFVNLVEIGWKEKIKAQEKIIFLEELLLGNPECLELQEILNQAKFAFEKDNYQKALELSESAVQACKYAVSSKGRTIELRKRYRFQDLVLPLLEALFFFLILYMAYYYLERRKLRKRR